MQQTYRERAQCGEVLARADLAKNAPHGAFRIVQSHSFRSSRAPRGTLVDRPVLPVEHFVWRGPRCRTESVGVVQHNSSQKILMKKCRNVKSASVRICSMRSAEGVRIAIPLFCNSSRVGREPRPERCRDNGSSFLDPENRGTAIFLDVAKPSRRERR